MSIGHTIWRMCFGKTRYTEAGARDRAQQVNGRQRRRGRHVHPYWCDVCGGYHVGGNRRATKEIRRGVV